MSNTLTVRLSDDIAVWLEETSKASGISKSVIGKQELERARKSPDRPFLRLAGSVEGPSDLSLRKGFSRGTGFSNK